MKLSKEAAVQRFGSCSNFLKTLEASEEEAFTNIGSHANMVFGQNNGRVYEHKAAIGEAKCSECGISVKANISVQQSKKVQTELGREVYVGFISPNHPYDYPQTTSVELPGDIASRCQHCSNKK